ncbi:MAG TPA: hydantoinase/oxoprolinase family protein, partial [Candidatus Dormibacteraeota bacterium]|nr:hydantoinase/oxoprolinase family protein [Candidatus Dormibacteraeota bacterium]
EMRARDLLTTLGEDEARSIAAASLKAEPAAVRLAGQTSGHYVFSTDVVEKTFWVFRSTRHPVRVVDRGGFIKVQRADALVSQTSAAGALDELRRLWGLATGYDGNGVLPPDAYLVLGSQVVDLSGMMALDHALSVASSELSGRGPEEPLVLVAAKRVQARL